MKGQILLLGFLAGVVAVTMEREPTRRADQSHRVNEQARLRAHFDSVLDDLHARDISRLTTEQRAARSELTTWLTEYRDAGRFPLNDRYAERQTPIFRDARGVTCAVAYLVERSGRRDIVDRVEREQNLAYVGELTADPEFVAWLDSAGLAAEEAARIQPTYPPEPDEIVDKQYARSAVLWSSASITTATWNLAKPGDRVGILGVFVGLITIFQSGMGPDYTLGNSRPRDGSIDAISRVTGASALAAGIWAISRKPQSRKPTGRSARFDVTPILGVPIGSKQLTVGLATRF